MVDKKEIQAKYKATSKLIDLTNQYLEGLMTSDELGGLDSELYSKLINDNETLLTQLEADKNECMRILRGE